MDATTIVLPAEPAPARRPPMPVLAAIVPVLAGVVLWLVTGSLFALCFAALGPLMLVASFVDGMRVRRKEGRRAAADADEAWRRAEAERERLHLAERAELRRRHPDAAGCLAEPPLRGLDPPDATTPLVIGRGARSSRVTASGGDDERSRTFRERTVRLEDAPVVVALGGGVCVRASRPVAVAVARALVVQLCLRFGPAQLGITGGGAPEWGLGALPHAGRRHAAFRLRIGEGTPGEGADAGAATICVREPGEEPPEGVMTVLDCADPLRATARTIEGRQEVAVEGLSEQQARRIAAECAARADEEAGVPAAVALADIAPAAAEGLAARFGRGAEGDVTVDLVEDGPHAIVTGMTGTGKSELLISWVTALALERDPAEVAFVLVDFKGGTAFDPLRVLPHVVARITDLDAGGAERGVRSLTAELRRREAALAAAGARDVRDHPGLGRLVIVVDEFAALLQEHPDLGAVFTDVAARGRALGMHLVLGTQRAAGVIREALAANCPLRISLRVAEAADSRLVLGTDAASALPGGPETRGLAFVRRPRDAVAQPVRVALAAPADLRRAAGRWADAIAQPSPWLPPLPTALPLPDGAVPGGTERPAVADRPDGAVLLGLADEPERQRQPWVVLENGGGMAVLGGPGAGKSTVLWTIAAQQPSAVVIPADVEDAWDAVAELATGRHGPVLCDDLDVLVSQYPPEHAQLFLSRWETILRSSAGAVVTLSRVSGPVGRAIDLLPRRALLRMPGRVEHIAAGGEPSSYDRDRPQGRALLDGRETQFCLPPGGDPPQARSERGSGQELWTPRRPLSGVVTPAPAMIRTALERAHPGHRVCGLEPGGVPDERPVILVADPEEWRSQWARVQAVRSSGELLVAAECPIELRQLAGVREPPPFARTHADRAWSVDQGRPPRRVLLG